jgi:KipI family sensor histidine kinase inhibitor
MGSSVYKETVFRIAGDRGLLAEYGNDIDPAINQKVRFMAVALGREPVEGVVEFIPTYRSIIFMYDPMVTTPARLKKDLLALEGRLADIEIPPPDMVEIPVCYGGEFGPDIDMVAAGHGLTLDDVIEIHSKPAYLVYMIGFTPGYPFLGGLDERLHTPRRQTPRTFVPAGSVGIANAQTGIYSINSPGGWQLIGRTPIKLFDLGRNAFLLKAGDLLRFNPITREEYDLLAKGGEV